MKIYLIATHNLQDHILDLEDNSLSETIELEADNSIQKNSVIGAKITNFINNGFNVIVKRIS